MSPFFKALMANISPVVLYSASKTCWIIQGMRQWNCLQEAHPKVAACRHNLLLLHKSFIYCTFMTHLHILQSLPYCICESKFKFTFPKWPRPRTATHLKSVKLNGTSSSSLKAWPHTLSIWLPLTHAYCLYVAVMSVIPKKGEKTIVPYFSFSLNCSQFQARLLIFNQTVILWFSYWVVQEVKGR